MATIVKRYPPKGNLQLLRYDTQAPFECWRCRKTKISKLQAIASLEKPRLICNACYGYLLSLSEIKARDVEPWYKADQIHDLTLKEVSAKVAAQAAEKQSRRYKQYWRFLSPQARRFIGTAEYLFEYMTDRDDLDFSPLIIELVKSFEHECVSSFVEPLRDRVARVVVTETEVEADCQDKDIGRMASYTHGRVAKPPELGTIAHTLTTLIHSKQRVQNSRFLKTLAEHVASCRDKGYFLEKERFIAQVTLLTQNYRNPAAHTGSMSKQKYEECKVAVLGASGALWQLIAATR